MTDAPNRFFASAACRSELHCRACRNPGAEGQQFRAPLVRIFNLPERFECPYGKPWGDDTPPPPVGTPEQLAVLAARMAEAWAKLGPAMWAELHTRRGADAAYVADFTSRIPCGECRRHFRELLVRMPPVFCEGWFEWTVNAHNAVNERLNKPTMTVDEARARWSAAPVSA